jgi:putative Mn2+ efflux pump MntP
MQNAAANASGGQKAKSLQLAGIATLAAGLLGHVLAARAIGGSYIAYRDHLLGFVVLTAVSGALLYMLGRRFWRAHPEYTLLTVGVLQAGFGLWAYVERFSFHG